MGVYVATGGRGRNDSRGSRKSRKFPSLATRIASRHSIRSVCCELQRTEACGRGGSLRFLLRFTRAPPVAASDERTERVLRTAARFPATATVSFSFAPVAGGSIFERTRLGRNQRPCFAHPTSRAFVIAVPICRDHSSVDRSREAARARARETVFTIRSIAATVFRRWKEYK